MPAIQARVTHLGAPRPSDFTGAPIPGALRSSRTKVPRLTAHSSGSKVSGVSDWPSIHGTTVQCHG